MNIEIASGIISSAAAAGCAIKKALTSGTAPAPTKLSTSQQLKNLFWETPGLAFLASMGVTACGFAISVISILGTYGSVPEEWMKDRASVNYFMIIPAVLGLIAGVGGSAAAIGCAIKKSFNAGSKAA